MAAFFRTAHDIEGRLAALELILLSELPDRADRLQTAIGQDAVRREQAGFNACSARVAEQANRIRQQLVAQRASNSVYKTQYAHQISNVRVRETQTTRLARKFQTIMAEYTQVQDGQKERYTKTIATYCRVVDPAISDADIAQVMHGGAHTIFSGVQLLQARDTLAAIDHRHQELLRLERSVQQVHDMFLDLAILVQDQGDLIDRVEFAVATSGDYVERTNVKLRDAASAQRAFRRKRCWVWGCCCVCVIIVAIAVFLGLFFKQPW